MTEAEKKQLAKQFLQIEKVPLDNERLSIADIRAIEKGREDFANGKFKELDEIEW